MVSRFLDVTTSSLWRFIVVHSETLVAKMSKEPQPPLGGMFRNEHFGHLADIEDPMEEDIDVPEESQALENSNFDEEFGPHDIVD